MTRKNLSWDFKKVSWVALFPTNLLFIIFVQKIVPSRRAPSSWKSVLNGIFLISKQNWSLNENEQQRLKKIRSRK